MVCSFKNFTGGLYKEYKQVRIREYEHMRINTRIFYENIPIYKMQLCVETKGSNLDHT